MLCLGVGVVCEDVQENDDDMVIGCDDFLDCGSWNVVEGVERGYGLDVLVGDVVIGEVKIGEVMIVGEILIGDVDVVDLWVLVMVTGP